MNDSALKESNSIGKGWTILLAVSLLFAAIFFAVAGLPYLLPGSERIGAFAGREAWIVAHIVFGTVAILIGPFQIRLGLKGSRVSLHKKLGYTYIGAISASSIAAFYLAVTTRNGWVFGMGLFGLGVAWVVTTGMAYLAVRKHDYLQHQEWMIRSYVVTFGFVFFRIFVTVTSIMDVGHILERLAAASWICWAAPLLFTEAIIQGRKILK